MSIIDLIEQQVALHREVFGGRPTHVALCRRHMDEVVQHMCTPTATYVPATIKGLSLHATPTENHLPYIY